MNRYYEQTKRKIDFLLSIAVIIIFFPICILIATLIMIDTKGFCLYKTKRLGRGGAFFNKYKFRTMVPNAEEVLKKILEENSHIRKEYKENYKIEYDPRITRFGKFLRKFSLDELPQFINVLKGDMSIVGPRDIIEQELDDHYNHCKEKFLSVKPGITGLWQVSGRSRLTYEERVKLDMFYIENRSLLFDFKIILKTPYVMIKGDGAI